MSTLRGPKNEIIFLQVVALKRTICTSDDPLTLLCATANIFTIDEPRYLEGLWSDEMFHSRFLELCTNPYQRIVQLLGRDRDEAAISAARLYRGALCHIFLSLDPADRHWRLLDGEVPQDILKAIMSEPLIDSSWLIQPDMVDGCSPALIEAALASWMLRACVEYVPVERIGSHLTEYSDSLSISSWKLVSLIVYILTRFPHPGGWTEIIEDGPQPFHSSPKRYDTVGSVMTTGPPLFTQPFIQPISTGQPGRPVFIDQSGQPIFTSQPVPPFGTGQPVQPMIWTGQPVPPFGTGQSVQPMIYTGQPVQPFITGQSVQPVFTGQPGQPISTGQPVLPFEFVTGQPGQPIFTGQPGQLVFDGQPGQPIVTGHPVPPFITGQPGQRVITGQPGQPISTSQPGQPFIIGQPGQPIVVGQSAPSFITGQPVPPNFTGQSGQSVITGQPGRPVLTGQPGQPIFIGRSVPPLITNEPVPQFKFVEGVSIDEPGGSVAVRIDPFRQPNFTGQPVYPFITVQSGQPMFSPLRRSRSYTGQIHEVSIDVNDMITRSGPPVLNIAELRSAYTRNVGMSLTALEEVAIALARQRYAGDLDCHRILLNILKCARGIIIDESRYPNTRVRDKLGLLDIAEQVLRIEDIPVQVRAPATMLRMDCVTMLRLRFMTGDARRKIPSELLVLLGNFFFKLRTRGDGSQLSNEEDLLVLRLFGPLLRELYSYPTNVWKIPDGSSWGSPMARLMILCHEVRQVYHQFRARVDRASRAFQACLS
ncbi:hypothetical protein FRC05_006525 [Tulasnella sp. 425]|nr:hypothetical protein FRC05_006525 [Tulasnella sp. 425]